MNEDAKKKLLRMIPHALYVLTSQASGKTAASTVSWLTQASFQPPLIMLGVKKESFTFQVVREARSFVLHFLGSDQKTVAQKFFKHVEPEGNSLAGEVFTTSPLLKMPLLLNTAGFLECHVLEFVDKGDHVVAVAQVMEAEGGPLEGPLHLSSTGWHYGG